MLLQPILIVVCHLKYKKSQYIIRDNFRPILATALWWKR